MAFIQLLQVKHVCAGVGRSENNNQCRRYTDPPHSTYIRTLGKQPNQLIYKFPHLSILPRKKAITQFGRRVSLSFAISERTLEEKTTTILQL